jgi:hypothetical protein
MRSTKSEAMYDLVDASSLLWRIELTGNSVGDRWLELAELWQKYMYAHAQAFNDCHAMMAFVSASKHNENSMKLLKSMTDYVTQHQDPAVTNSVVTSLVGLPLCSALKAYKEGNYSQAVELILPIQNKVVTVGGSTAQRDIFTQTLIGSALNSPRTLSVVSSLISERCKEREGSVLSWKLCARLHEARQDEPERIAALEKVTALLQEDRI